MTHVSNVKVKNGRRPVRRETNCPGEPWKKRKKRENASKIMPPDDREIITSLTKLVIRFDRCLSD